MPLIPRGKPRRREKTRRAVPLTRLARGSFAPKPLAPASQSAPQRVGFGLGPPALISAQAGENRAPEGAAEPIFLRRREKIAWGGLSGARLEMLLGSHVHSSQSAHKHQKSTYAFSFIFPFTLHAAISLHTESVAHSHPSAFVHFFCKLD